MEAPLYKKIYPTLYIPYTGQIWLELDNKFRQTPTHLILFMVLQMTPMKQLHSIEEYILCKVTNTLKVMNKYPIVKSDFGCLLVSEGLKYKKLQIYTDTYYYYYQDSNIQQDSWRFKFVSIVIKLKLIYLPTFFSTFIRCIVIICRKLKSAKSSNSWSRLILTYPGHF